MYERLGEPVGDEAKATVLMTENISASLAISEVFKLNPPADTFAIDPVHLLLICNCFGIADYSLILQKAAAVASALTAASSEKRQPQQQEKESDQQTYASRRMQGILVN